MRDNSQRPAPAPAQSPSVTLLGPQDVRHLADQVGIVPTKKLGQNFVHDPNTVRRIVAAAELKSSDHVMEVGPGLGSLTLGLAEAVSTITAVEIDPRLASQLPLTWAHRAGGRAELTVLNQDALTVSPSDFPSPPTALVANLPYNVSVPVLLHVLAEFPSISRVLVMVQSEVADRLAAQPGSKMYGVPSVKARFFGDVRRAGAIGRTVFWPVPNVESGLIRIDRYTAPAWPVTEAARRALFPLIDAAFAQRRKTLRAALSGYYGGGQQGAQQAESALRAAGIDPQLRGEKLGIEEFVHLAGISPQEEAAL